MADSPKTVPTSVANALLVLFLVFFGISVGLGGFIYVRYREPDAEQKRLTEALSQAKSRDQLMAELMVGDNNWALFPHADKRVGFVLNRHVVWTGLYAAKDDKYPINSMGLRGNPIEPKAAGVTRIALVSDSWFFGWRLLDGQRLQAQLTALLQKHYPDKRYEVITVAVPGWNVENQAAFLEDYFDRLQPDVLVWSINANDLWDTQSVVPPGVPATRPAPGSPWLCPDTGFAWSTLATPLVMERWRKNIAMMEGISRSYGVPILALHVYELEPYVSMIRKLGGASFPIVSTPREFTKDPRWELEPGVDSHPTPWAIQLIAVDVLGHLIEYGHLPPAQLSREQQSIIEKGRAASRGVSDDQVEAFINTTRGIPASYDRASAQVNNPSITSKWEACPQGRMSLGRANGANTAEISFDDIRNDNGRSNTLSCSARTKDGQTFKGESIDDAGARICRIAIPPSPTDEIVDLYWQFPKFTCDVADDCFSARFKSAKVF